MAAYFKKDGDSYVTWITGPTHNLLGLRFGAPVGATPEIIALPPVDNGEDPAIEERELLKAVQQGVAEVNEQRGTALTVARILYVPNDTPAYGFYVHCARLLTEQAADEAGEA